MGELGFSAIPTLSLSKRGEPYRNYAFKELFALEDFATVGNSRCARGFRKNLPLSSFQRTHRLRPVSFAALLAACYSMLARSHYMQPEEVG